MSDEHMGDYLLLKSKDNYWGECHIGKNPIVSSLAMRRFWKKISKKSVGIQIYIEREQQKIGIK